jgi:hypothetical protein
MDPDGGSQRCGVTTKRTDDVAQENAPELPIEGWLKTLGIDSLTQWDVLGFVYRHRTSLVGAEAIARLLGYANDPVLAALDVLESLGFVERSRAAGGVRLYQFNLPTDSPRRDSFERLTALADSRAGRLRLIKVVRARDQAPPRCHAANGNFAEASPLLPLAKPRSALATTLDRQNSREYEGGATWRQVI